MIQPTEIEANPLTPGEIPSITGPAHRVMTHYRKPRILVCDLVRHPDLVELTSAIGRPVVQVWRAAEPVVSGDLGHENALSITWPEHGSFWAWILLRDDLGGLRDPGLLVLVEVGENCTTYEESCKTEGSGSITDLNVRVRELRRPVHWGHSGVVLREIQFDS